MNDEAETHPGFKAYRPPQCGRCLRPVHDHNPFCLAVADEEGIRRAIIAQHHFGTMTKMERALALACGAADKGATLHWHGVLP